MKVSNLCVSTSKQEGLPVNIMEAMIVGLPIILTNCRGNRDLIQDEKNGYLIDINNIEQLENKILKIYNSDFKLQQLELSKYYKESIKKEMIQIYNKVLQKKVIMLRSTSIKNDSRVMREAETLCKAGYDVEILGWDRDQFLNGETEKIEANNRCINIKVLKKTAKYAGGMKSILKLISFEWWLIRNLIKRKKEVDIIHSCDFDTAIPARIISKIYKKKLVYDIFDYYIDSHYVPNKLKRIVEKTEIKIINKADLTIICTEQRKEQIKKAIPKKCIVIYNTPDIETYNLDNKILKSNSDKLKLVYVGILQENRLLKEIGEKIKENSEIELHIGGFGTLEEYFEELSRKYSNVFYYGKMEYKDVLSLEKDCDVLFATYNPSISNHKYSAPNKLYEAMALGKPIIVCKGTGIDKIVNREKIGYSISYDANRFISYVKKINEDEKLREEFSHNAKKIYNEQYSGIQMERKLIQGYEYL